MAAGLIWWAPQAWVDGRWQAGVVLASDAQGCWSSVTPGYRQAPEQASVLAGPALPGLVDAHGHAFQRAFAGKRPLKRMPMGIHKSRQRRARQHRSLFRGLTVSWCHAGPATLCVAGEYNARLPAPIDPGLRSPPDQSGRHCSRVSIRLCRTRRAGSARTGSQCVGRDSSR